MRSLSPALGQADPFRPPPAPGLARGMGFAFVAHGLLVLALSAGIAWHSQPEPAFEAELWSVLPQAAAPRAVEPEPEPEPEPQRKPDPKPAVQEDTQQQQRDAQIAIERERKKREEQLRREEEQRRELERKRLEKEKADKAEKDKLAREKAEKDKLDKQRQQQEAREKARDEAKREQLRQDNLRRMMGLAGASGGPGSTGTALQSSGPSATYAGRIKAKIRPNIIFSDSASGNPLAEVEVRVAPDGNIIARRLTKPSGNADWDAAVLRAIDRTEVLPRDTDGRVPPVMVISFKYGE